MTQATELRELASLLRVNGGNVGIGPLTADPPHTLSLGQTNVAGAQTIRLAGNGNPKHEIQFREAGVGYGFTFRYAGDAADNKLHIVAHEDDTNGTEAISIKRDGGNVGIGETSPDAPLHVTSSSTVSSDETLIIEAPIYPNLRFNSTNTNTNNRNWNFSSVYNSYGTFEILRSASANTVANITTLSMTKDGRVAIGPSHVANYVLDVQGDIHTTTTFRADESRHEVFPILNLDFTTKRLDSRIQFSRVGQASYMGSNGLVEYVNGNQPRFDHDPITGECLGLLIEPSSTNLADTSTGDGTSLDFNAMYRTKYDGVAPDGSHSASRILANVGTSRHEVNIRYVGTSGEYYAISVYLKPLGSVTHVGLSKAGGTEKVIMDLINGTHGTPGGTSTARITPLKDGWMHCSMTYLEASTGFRSFYMSPGIGAGSSSVYNNLNGDGKNGLMVWGAQVEKVSANKRFISSYIPQPQYVASRASKATYHDENGYVRSVSRDTERWGYRYDSGLRKFLPLGAMIEEAKTQMAPSTENFGSAWYTNNCTKSSSTTILPNGTNGSAFKLIMNNGANPASATAAGMYIGITAALNSSPFPYANSIYVKADGENIFRIRDGLRTGAFCDFDLSSGTITANADVFQQTHMEKMANDWWRCSFVYEFRGAVGFTGTWLAMRGGSTGDGTSGLLLWGAQMEINGTTSYIHNAGAAGAVTRAADVYLAHEPFRGMDLAILPTKDIKDFDSNEITVFHDIEGFEYAQNSRLWSLDDGTLDNRISPQTNTETTLRLINIDDGDTKFNIVNVAITNWQDRHRYAFAMTDTSAKLYVDGTSAFSGTSSGGATSTKVDRLRIGGLNEGFPSVGRHRKLTIYNKALSSSNLEALTGDPS